MAKQSNPLNSTGEFFKRTDEWRNHPWLSKNMNLRTALPGFRTAVVIFSVYCVAENVYYRLYPSSDSHH